MLPSWTAAPIVGGAGRGDQMLERLMTNTRALIRAVFDAVDDFFRARLDRAQLVAVGAGRPDAETDRAMRKIKCPNPDCGAETMGAYIDLRRFFSPDHLGVDNDGSLTYQGYGSHVSDEVSYFLCGTCGSEFDADKVEKANAPK